MSNEKFKKGNAGKAWNRQKKPRGYNVNSQLITKRFLILCEGETEKDYFSAFPVASAEAKVLSKGESRKAIVLSAIDAKKQSEYKGYEIWVVFDMDFDTQTTNNCTDLRQDFDQAIELSKQKGIQTAYSNDSFELWYLLHYESCGCQNRRYYCERLKEIWKDHLKGMSYGKNEKFRRKTYELLLPKQEEAIEKAKKLHQYHSNINTKCSKQNPCNTAYLLVEELNKYLKK